MGSIVLALLGFCCLGNGKMVIINLGSYHHIEYYYQQLRADGLIKERDFVYRILPSGRDDPAYPVIRVGFEFRDDRLASFYGLKWS